MREKSVNDNFLLAFSKIIKQLYDKKTDIYILNNMYVQNTDYAIK